MEKYKKLQCNKCGEPATENKKIKDVCGQHLFRNFDSKETYMAPCDGIIKEYDDFDGAHTYIIARELKRCAQSWEPTARLLGNVRAEDIIRLCNQHMAQTKIHPDRIVHYPFMDMLDFPEPPDPEISDEVWSRYETSLISFFKKHNISITDAIAEQFNINQTES